MHGHDKDAGVLQLDGEVLHDHVEGRLGGPVRGHAAPGVLGDGRDGRGHHHDRGAGDAHGTGRVLVGRGREEREEGLGEEERGNSVDLEGLPHHLGSDPAGGRSLRREDAGVVDEQVEALLGAHGRGDLLNDLGVGRVVGHVELEDAEAGVGLGEVGELSSLCRIPVRKKESVCLKFGVTVMVICLFWHLTCKWRKGRWERWGS